MAIRVVIRNAPTENAEVQIVVMLERAFPETEYDLSVSFKQNLDEGAETIGAEVLCSAGEDKYSATEEVNAVLQHFLSRTDAQVPSCMQIFGPQTKTQVPAFMQVFEDGGEPASYI